MNTILIYKYINIFLYLFIYIIFLYIIFNIIDNENYCVNFIQYK